MPYVRPVREALLSSELQMISELTELAAKYSKLNDLLLKKAAKLQRRRLILSDEAKVREILEAIDNFLETIEQELSLRPKECWITGTDFTSLDAALGIFLHRLFILGLEEYFWVCKKPCLEYYFMCFIERESFKLAVPSVLQTMRAIWGKVPSLKKITYLAISASSLALAGSVILSK